MQKERPYLLFDAGGTLVFPDEEFLIAVALACGIHLTHEHLHDAYYRIIYKLDQKARHKPPFPEDPWPDGYAHTLATTLRLKKPAAACLAEEWRQRHRKRNLWAFTRPEVRETLILLRRAGYRMSVLSNSDGRTSTVFKDLRLLSFFDYIFDSKELRAEKPQRQVFDKILSKLSLSPRDVIYIGDIYTVDVWGARAAGMGAIHLDPLENYRDKRAWPGVHLSSVEELPTWLEGYLAQPRAYPLFEPRRVPYLEQAERQTERTSPKLLPTSRKKSGTFDTLDKWPALTCWKRQRRAV